LFVTYVITTAVEVVHKDVRSARVTGYIADEWRPLSDTNRRVAGRILNSNGCENRRLPLSFSVPYVQYQQQWATLRSAVLVDYLTVVQFVTMKPEGSSQFSQQPAIQNVI